MGWQPLMISYSNYQKAAHSENNMEKGGGTIKKGAWSREEDRKLTAYIKRYGIWNWNHMAKPAGLARSGKSCRLRWMNYLKPGVRHGNFTKEEEDTIIKWHQLLGNKWSMIATKLEGRTDNEIKNYWHTRIKKRIAKAVVTQDYKPMQYKNSQPNKVSHSNYIISQTLTQAVNNEATYHNTTPNSESELVSLEELLDYTMEDELIWGKDDRKSSVNNGTEENTSPCTDDSTESVVWPLDYSLPNEFTKSSSSGIAAENDNIWEQLPSLDDLLMGTDFGVTSVVSDRLTLPYSLQQSLANDQYLFYDDLWESLLL